MQRNRWETPSFAVDFVQRSTEDEGDIPEEWLENLEPRNGLTRGSIIEAFLAHGWTPQQLRKVMD